MKSLLEKNLDLQAEIAELRKDRASYHKWMATVGDALGIPAVAPSAKAVGERIVALYDENDRLKAELDASRAKLKAIEKTASPNQRSEIFSKQEEAT